MLSRTSCFDISEVLRFSGGPQLSDPAIRLSEWHCLQPQSYPSLAPELRWVNKSPKRIVSMLPLEDLLKKKVVKVPLRMME
jgi:hypothetical protein